MKDGLSRAVEAVSLFTAVGVVVSVVVYSIQFKMFGLNYISIASLADILRDSLKLLILFLAGLIAVTPYNAIATMTWVPRKFGERLLFTGVASLGFVLLLGLLFVVAIVVGGNSAIEAELRNIPIGIGYGSLILFVLIWGMIYLTVRVYPDEIRYHPFRLKLETASDKVRFGILLLLWVAGAIFIVSTLMVSQMQTGLAMEVEISGVGNCPYQPYKVVWMGDSKAVLKCEGTETYFVKVLN